MHFFIHERIKWVLFSIIVILLIIVMRVFYIQTFTYQKLHTLAENLWSRNLPITADRGLILDRNGKILAGNVTTTSLVLVPNQITNKVKVTKDLAKILNVSEEEMKKHVYKKTSIERVHPEGRQLSFKVADEINNLNYDGVYLLKESKRYYPNETLLAHTLGYVGIDNQGLSGLELVYDKYLTGKNGSIKYFSDGKGHRLAVNEIYEAPASGMNIELTIDLDIQKSIERELYNLNELYHPDQALILAVNPNTMEILGMGSTPSFNPNHYQTASTETINRNLPIWMTYEPGSTFKIVTLAATIEEKTLNIFKDTYYDSGSIMVENARIKCWKAGGHGAQTFLEVVENSCNPGFVVMGQKLGKERLFKYINTFGFGKKTGVDLNGEASGILFNIDKVGPVELATTAFGQGISVTPIQQITAVSSIINGGKLFRPFIVKNIMEPVTKSLIQNNEPFFIRNVISEETSKTVRYVLESVVANGTGRNAYIENYRVGGKTGTAQKVEAGHYMVGNYIVSFMGFMPADNPEIVVYVAVDNPKGITQYGGTVAAPIAKSILKDYVSIYQLPETSDGMSREYTWLDTKYNKIPDVVGLSVKEANKLLKGYKIEYSGEGDKVIYQSPKKDTYVEENGNVKLLLSD